jgi:uncharacterized small protein (DUF1192 family)
MSGKLGIWTLTPRWVKGARNDIFTVQADGENMAEDEDGPVMRPALVNKPVLDVLGIGELRDYIAALREEIARAEAMIARKGDHRGAAEAMFRRG